MNRQSTWASANTDPSNPTTTGEDQHAFSYTTHTCAFFLVFNCNYFCFKIGINPLDIKLRHRNSSGVLWWILFWKTCFSPADTDAPCSQTLTQTQHYGDTVDDDFYFNSLIFCVCAVVSDLMCYTVPGYKCSQSPECNHSEL